MTQVENVLVVVGLVVFVASGIGSLGWLVGVFVQRRAGGVTDGE